MSIDPETAAPCSGEVTLMWLSTSSTGPFASGSAVGTPYTWSTGLPPSMNCTGARSCAAACIV